MKFGNFEQKRPIGNSPKQESAPVPKQNPLDQWVNQSRSIIDAIDHSPQLEETEPGIRFSQDLAQLLDSSVLRSETALSELFDALENDLHSHDFLTFGDKIIMAHDTSVIELGNLFSKASSIIKILPLPENNPSLFQKRDLLAKAFEHRALQLSGK